MASPSASVAGIVKLVAPAQKAAITPPIGPTLGQRGIKAAEFVKKFNDETKKFVPGTPMRVNMRVKPDKSYSYEIRTPNTTWFFKRCTGTLTCKTPTNAICGVISMRQIYEISRIKYEVDAHFQHLSLESVCRQIFHRAKALGFKVIE